MMDAVGISADFRTQHTLRGRMVGITRDLDRTAVFDGHAHRACVRTIVRANGPSYLSGDVHHSGCDWGGGSQILRGWTD